MCVRVMKLMKNPKISFKLYLCSMVRLRFKIDEEIVCWLILFFLSLSPSLFHLRLLFFRLFRQNFAI